MPFPRPLTIDRRHFIGLGHVGCPKEGAKAPVMMQQSIELGGCTPNAWPRDAD